MANDNRDFPRGRSTSVWAVAIIVALLAVLTAWLFRFPWGLLPPQP